jgi:hypothetical protein
MTTIKSKSGNVELLRRIHQISTAKLKFCNYSYPELAYELSKYQPQDLSRHI